MHELGQQREAWEQRRAEAELGRLTPAILSLKLPSALPGGYRFRIDGRTVSGTRFPLPVGKHRLEVTGPWVQRMDSEIELRVAEEREVDVRRAPMGLLHLSVPLPIEDLVVKPDGKPIAPGAAAVPFSPGERTIEASAPEQRGASWTVKAQDGPTAMVAVDLTSPAGTPVWFFCTAAAGTLLGVGIGSYRSRDLRAAEDAKEPRLRMPDAENQISRESTGAIISFAVGGVLGAGAIVLATTTRWRGDRRVVSPRRTRVTGLAPSWSAGGVGLSLLVQF